MAMLIQCGGKKFLIDTDIPESTEGWIIAGGSNAAINSAKIWKSVNYGENWSFVSALGTIPYDLLNLGGGTMIAASNLGVYATENFGDAWTNIGGPKGYNFDTFEDGSIIAAKWDSYGRFARSVDNGKTWASLGNNLRTGEETSCYNYCVAYGGGGECIGGITSTTGEGVGLVYYVKIYKSTNYGVSWSFQQHLNDFGGDPYFPYRVCYLGNNTYLMTISRTLPFYDTERKIYRSIDGGSTWTYLNDIIGNFYLNMGGGIVYSGKNNLYRSDDYGATWNLVYSLGTGVGSMIRLGTGSRFLLGTRTGGNIYYSSDNCSSWRLLGSLSDGGHVTCLSSISIT